MTQAQLAPERSQVSGVKPMLLSHGTLMCKDLAASRRFYEEFLGSRWCATRAGDDAASEERHVRRRGVRERFKGIGVDPVSARRLSSPIG